MEVQVCTWKFRFVRASSDLYVEVQICTCKFRFVRASSGLHVVVQVCACKFRFVRASSYLYVGGFQILDAKFIKGKSISCNYIESRHFLILIFLDQLHSCIKLQNFAYYIRMEPCPPNGVKSVKNCSILRKKSLII